MNPILRRSILKAMTLFSLLSLTGITFSSIRVEGQCLSEPEKALRSKPTSVALTTLEEPEKMSRTISPDGVRQIRYPASNTPGELACDARYYLWIPKTAQKLRGIVVHQHGCGDPAGQGGATAADDLQWRALARKWNCALLGTSYKGVDQNCSVWADPRRGSQKRFHEALKEFANWAERPEIETIPWCLWGHSGGGWWCSWMAALEPEKVVALWMRSGTAYGGKEALGEYIEPKQGMYAIPMMTNPGIQEKDDDRFKETYFQCLAMFDHWRKKGAMIGLAIDPKSTHDCGGSRYLAIPFFDACLGLRLPERYNLALKPMPSSQVWLGDRDTSNVEVAKGSSLDLSRSIWLPNEKVAKAWSEYVKSSSVSVKTTVPSPTNLKSNPDGDAVTLSRKCEADMESGLQGFEILRDGVKIGEISGGSNGNRSLFQGLSFHDTPDEPLKKMEFRDMGSLKSGNSLYAIIAIDTAGNRSKPSKGVRAR